MLNRYILGMFSLNVPFLLDSFGKNHEHNRIFFNILLLQTKVSGSIACRYFFKEKYFCLYLFGSVMFNPKSYFTIGARADTTKYSTNLDLDCPRSRLNSVHVDYYEETICDHLNAYNVCKSSCKAKTFRSQSVAKCSCVSCERAFKYHQ